jgi:hypothetical protein
MATVKIFLPRFLLESVLLLFIMLQTSLKAKLDTTITNATPTGDGNANSFIGTGIQNASSVLFLFKALKPKIFIPRA